MPPGAVLKSMVLLGCLAGLSGCGGSFPSLSSFKLPQLPDLLGTRAPDSAPADPSATGSVSSQDSRYAAYPSAGPSAPISGVVGGDLKSDLNVGKQQYRAGHYGDAEKYFRRAVETNPREAEAWLGLAASYDRLKRFDLADRAYDEALKLAGPRPEILNNQGFSYLLRGDYARAREKLLSAQAKDPANPYIRNNLAQLEETMRTGKPPP